MRENYPGRPYGPVFEDYPLWGEFCCRLLKDIHEAFHKDILVPMTLVRERSFRMIEELRNAGIRTELIILEASHATLHDRILARGESEECWCMRNIEMSRLGSAALPGLRIPTDGRTVKEVCEDVLAVAIPDLA